MIPFNLIIILILLIIGYLLKWNKNIPENTHISLNQIIIHVSLPALILLTIPKLKFNTDAFIPMLVAWSALLIGVIFVYITHKIFHWERPTLACLYLLIPLANTSFLGIPMIEVFLGKNYIPYAILYDQLGSFLILSTYGTFIISLFNQKSKFHLKLVVKKVITFPPFLALLLALILRHWSMPVWIQTFLKIASGTLVPLAMLAVGFQFQLRIPSKNMKPFFLGLSGKLLIIPLITLGIFKFFGFTGPAYETSILEAGMPSMITAGALANVAGFNPPLVASLLAWGILLCPLSLSMLKSIL